MTENQFDEFFRKKLEDHSSKVPEDMWQRIKQKKDKDRTIVILLLLLLLLTGGASSYFIFNSKENVKEDVVLSQKNAGNKASLNQNKKHELNNTQNDTVNSKQDKNPIVQNKTGLNSELASEKNNETKTSEDKNYRESKIQENKNNFHGDKQGMSNLSHANANDDADLAANNSSTLLPKQNEEVAVKKDDQKKLLVQKDSTGKEKNNTKIKTANNNHESIINNIFLEVYASPDIPVSRTSGNNSYLQHKDSTSEMQLSYTFGVRLGALLGEHFTVKTGLQYSEVNEKFNYTEKNATRTVPVVLQRTLTDANGIERTVLDTSTLIQVGSQYKLNYNHYKSLDIPVLIGYQTAGDRFNASINTGVILNIKTNYKGDILDASLNAVDINSNNFYKSNTGVSLYLGLGLSTKLNNNFQLFTEPFLKYRLSNMTGAHQPFTQKINVGGLSLGLRYNF